MTEDKNLRIGVVLSGQFKDTVAVLGHFPEITEKYPGPLGFAMTALIVSVHTVPIAVELFHRVVIAIEMLAQTVGNDNDSLWR